MNSIYLLIPLSVLLVGVAVWAFFWAVNRGQFEELDERAAAALEEDPINEDATSPRE
jgi:cbb3-type cytochrome oxidase maturation protein